MGEKLSERKLIVAPAIVCSVDQAAQAKVRQFRVADLVGWDCSRRTSRAFSLCAKNLQLSNRVLPRLIAQNSVLMFLRYQNRLQHEILGRVVRVSRSRRCVRREQPSQDG